MSPATECISSTSGYSSIASNAGRLAPAGGVDMDKGEQRLADGLGIDQRRHATDRARAAQALYALMRGRWRKPDAFAEFGVAHGRVLDQGA